jgi:hypothetical protein
MPHTLDLALQVSSAESKCRMSGDNVASENLVYASMPQQGFKWGLQTLTQPLYTVAQLPQDRSPRLRSQAYIPQDNGRVRIRLALLFALSRTCLHQIKHFQPFFPLPQRWFPLSRRPVSTSGHGAPIVVRIDVYAHRLCVCF